MNFNEIQLPGSVIADLFKHSLILPKPENKAEKNPDEMTSYRFLGNNDKKIVFVVSCKD